MDSSAPKTPAPPSKDSTSPVIFTSATDLDARLAEGTKHDVFIYRGDMREVVLENDCRSYPLRVRASFETQVASASIDAFQKRCERQYGCTFRSSIPGAQKTRIPEVAVKVGLYHTLDTVEVHFYKDSPRADRRRLIGWLVHTS